MIYLIASFFTLTLVATTTLPFEAVMALCSCQRPRRIVFLIMVEKVVDFESLEAGVAHEADTVALLFTTLVELS